MFVISDHNTKCVLHLTTEMSVARTVFDVRYGTLHVNLTHKRSIPNDFDYNRPWSTNIDARGKYTPNHNEVPNEEIYRLLSEQLWATEQLMSMLERFHTHAAQGELLHQQRIYDTKAEQAKALLSGQTQEFNHTYYVHGWSELRGISLEQAAKEIIFKHEEHDIFLFQIEQLRLKYQLRIKAATTVDELPDIMNEFHHECITYGNI